MIFIPFTVFSLLHLFPIITQDKERGGKNERKWVRAREKELLRKTHTRMHARMHADGGECLVSSLQMLMSY